MPPGSKENKEFDRWLEEWLARMNRREFEEQGSREYTTTPKEPQPDPSGDEHPKAA